MKNSFKAGDKLTYKHKVNEADMAAFKGDAVHSVYSTFAVARDAEWCCRLFVLEMKEDDEEGIGTFVNVIHLAPALLNSEILYEAEIEELFGNTINCKWEARHGERVIAKGTQGQKILKKAKLEKLFADLQKQNNNV